MEDAAEFTFIKGLFYGLCAISKNQKAGHRNSDASPFDDTSQNLMTTGSCEKEEMVAVASLK